MKKISKPIVFFGSGPVAAKSLALLAMDFAIEAVITKPRPPHHKGAVPVIDVAQKLQLKLRTAQNRQELDALFSNHPFEAELAILIDFGIIVSQQVIDYFRFGIINSHFSLLPAWRGADPITFSILNDDKKTGVSLMLLVEAMDEGPLLAQAPYELRSDSTTPELTEDLIEVSYATLKEVVPLYLTNLVQPIPQEDGQATYSRKLTKEDGIIDWRKPAEVIEREIRAFSGWPKSHTTFGTQDLVIIKAHVARYPGPAGTTAIIDKQPLVYCGDQALILDRIKPANKKEMSGSAYLAGYKNSFLSNS